MTANLTNGVGEPSKSVADIRTLPETIQALVDTAVGNGVAKAEPLVAGTAPHGDVPKHPDDFCLKCMADGTQAWFGGCDECEAFAEAMQERERKPQSEEDRKTREAEGEPL